jgi:hypothetical protein
MRNNYDNEQQPVAAAAPVIQPLVGTIQQRYEQRLEAVTRALETAHDTEIARYASIQELQASDNPTSEAINAMRQRGALHAGTRPP